MKSRTGYVFKKGKFWVARITFTDPETGKRRNVRRFADTKSEASDLLQGLRQTHKDHGSKKFDGDKMNVGELIEKYTQAKLKPAEYKEERKIAGLRSHVTAKQHIEALKGFFGRKRLKSITPQDIEDFKQLRLKQPTIRKTERTIASVNRELESLRAMFNFAKQQGWMIISPFERKKGIISKADEKRRDRVISAEEEARLLDACTGRRAHLRPILICALDTGIRRGELLKLRWQNVDLDARTLTITAMNSKTARARQVGLTGRLLAELRQIWEVSPKDPTASVFGISSDFKNAWKAICAEAQVDEVRFHDTRHTCITRWVSRGLPIAEIMRLSGHSTLTAFSIYVNSTEQTVRRGAEALDAWNEEFSIQPVNVLVN